MPAPSVRLTPSMVPATHDPSEPAARRAALKAVHDCPGAHARRVAETANLPVSTARYHLERLAQGGRIAVESFGQYRAFYPPDVGDPYVRRVLHHLNRPVAGPILRLLAAHGPLDRARLADAVSRTVSTVSHHLRALREEDVVATVKNPQVRYGLTRPDEVRSALRRHPALWARCCPEHSGPP